MIEPLEQEGTSNFLVYLSGLSGLKKGIIEPLSTLRATELSGLILLT